MSKFEEFHAVLHSMQEREKQFLLQHLDASRLRRTQGGSEAVVPLVNLLIKYALEQRDGPDEASLITRLQKEGRYKSYPNTLFHAYRKILRLLHQAHQEEPSSEITHLLFVAGWMRGKRQLEQLESILGEAEKLATTFEFFQEERQLLEHRKFLHAIHPKKYKLDKIQARIQELREITSQLEDLTLLADEVQLRRLLLDTDGAATQVEQSPLLANIRECKSVRAKLQFLRAWTNLHISAGRYTKALESIREFVKLLEDNVHLMKDGALNSLYYKYAFSGLQTCIALGKKKDAESFRSILENGDLKANDPAKYFEYTTRVWLWMADVNETSGEIGHQRFQQIQRNLDKYGPVLGEGSVLIICHQVAVQLMLGGHPRRAIPWINQYMLSQPGLQNPELVAFAYVLFVLAKFEMREWDMVERGKRTALTFLQRHHLSNEVFDLLLKGLVRCSRHDGKPTFVNEIKALQEQISTALRQPNNAKANHYFNLVDWLERMAAS